MASRAEQEAGEAAAVEEQHRLLVAVERLADRLDEEAREQRSRAAHVDDLDLGQLLVGPDARAAVGLAHGAQAAREVEARDAALGGGVPALGVGRGGAEHERGAGERGEALGDGARVVAGRGVVLLVGPLVGLVDDDQAEVGLRREDRRARADHDVERPGRGLLPLVVGLAEREAGVEHADAAGEALGEAAHGLGGERNLGHQHEPAPAEPRGVRERVEVDLGLAAAGDAVQQQRAAVGAVDGGADRRACGALLVDQLDGRADGDVEVAQRIAAVEHLVDGHEPGVAQRVEGFAGAGAELARELGDRQLRLGFGGEPLEQACGGGLDARPRQLADATLGGGGAKREAGVALAVDLQQPVGDQRLHGGRAARDLREVVEGQRLACGVEQRAQGAGPP